MESTLRAVATLVTSARQRRQESRVSQCFQVDFKVLSGNAALSAFSAMEGRNAARPGDAAHDRIPMAGENLSFGGLGLAGDLELLKECGLAEGSFLEMQVQIPQVERRLHCVGTVAWTRADAARGSFRAGVSFLEVDQEDLSLAIGALQRMSAPWHARD